MGEALKGVRGKLLDPSHSLSLISIEEVVPGGEGLCSLGSLVEGEAAVEAGRRQCNHEGRKTMWLQRGGCRNRQGWVPLFGIEALGKK